jgi:parallel beta-helix repeat protein
MRIKRRDRRHLRLLVEELEPRVLMSTYYVAPTGNDQAAGGQLAPWKTLQHAADTVVAGDTVIVQAGTYAGFVMGWDFAQNGTPGNPIRFQAQPGVIINSRDVHTADGIDLEACSYVTIQGFQVLNPAGGTITRAGIRAAGTSNGVQILNNVADNCGTWGILTGFASNCLIQGNTCSNAQSQHGIYVSNACVNPQVIGNILFGNHACGLHMNGDLSQGGNGLIVGALVAGNVIYNNGAGGGSGINCDGVQNSVFENNLLYNNHASGISLYQIDAAAPAKNNIVVNNTIIMASDARWALNIVDGSTGNTAFNNILFNNNPGHGSINISADSLPGFKSDHNVVQNLFTPDDGNTFQTLAQWQAQTGQDLHSILATQAVVFKNPANNDFHLLATSPAIDVGTATNAPSTDLDGNPRPSGNGYDIGAYELQGTHLSVTGPGSATAGNSLSVTVSALAADNSAISGYTGTIHFTSSDLKAGLPADYTFTAADAGIHTFTVTLKTAGNQTVTATDTVTTSLIAQATITVSPGALNGFAVTGYSTPDTAGAAHSFQVTAQDAFGNTIKGYTGTVTFTSSDAAATLPAAYAFKATDVGAHTFTATLNTAGTQTITASDASAGVNGQQTGIQVVPGAAVTGPKTAVPGQPLTYTLTATEPGLPAGTVYSFAIDWDGDGQVDQTVQGPSGTTVSHTYTGTGSFTIGVTATDPGSNQSAPATLAVKVTAVAIEPDPLTTGKTALFVGGTIGDDIITITSVNSTTLSVKLNGVTTKGLQPTGHLYVYGQDGNDTIKEVAAVVNGAAVYIARPGFFFGGDGNDVISLQNASTANNVLVGGKGNDSLSGGGGRDLLIGGAGTDVLVGNGGSDLLIGSSTSYDANLQALAAVMAEWGRTDLSFTARINHLTGTTTGGKNGTTLLNAGNVQDDAAIDSLTGGVGTDWFILTGTGTTAKDIAKDAVAGEVVTAL